MGTTKENPTSLPDQSASKTPDRRILALSIARLADAVGNSFLFILLPIYIASGTITGDSFGMSETLFTGLVLGIFGLLSSLAQPLAGNLSDRLGRRKVFITSGLALLGVTTAAFAFAESYAAILIIRALQGVGVALTLPATIALVNEFSTRATRGRNMGVFNTFQMLGLGIAPVITGVIVEQGPYAISVFGTAVTLTGFDAAFYVAAATVFVSQLLVMLLVTDPQKPDASARSDLDVSVTGDAQTFDSTFALGMASLLMAVGITLLEPLQVQVNARLDQNVTMFGIQFAAYIVGQAVVQAPIGYASDRFGRKQFVVAGLVLLAPAVLAQGLVTEPWMMIGSRLLIGVAAAMVIAPGTALVGDRTEDAQSGTELGLLTMSFGLGSAIGPLAAGYLVGFGFVVPFVFGAIVAVFGALLVSTQVDETVGRGVRSVESTSEVTSVE